MAKITLPYLRDRFQYLFLKKYSPQQDFIAKIDAELAFLDFIGSDYTFGIGNRRS